MTISSYCIIGKPLQVRVKQSMNYFGKRTLENPLTVNGKVIFISSKALLFLKLFRTKVD
jgi:hypothetical protein